MLRPLLRTQEPIVYPLAGHNHWLLPLVILQSKDLFLVNDCWTVLYSLISQSYIPNFYPLVGFSEANLIHTVQHQFNERYSLIFHNTWRGLGQLLGFTEVNFIPCVYLRLMWNLSFVPVAQPTDFHSLRLASLWRY